ncbi:hypothetical protein ACSBPH_14675 [Microbacterium sp. F51-2R]|uniref:hypothetical protein n=1 Tax=Microbacterium sp. F51-2R TaxID=3445777 RepID=UPI003F9EEC40
MTELPLVLSVATLGRIEPLRTLLRSLEGQLRATDRVVIVAQGHVEEVQAIAHEFHGTLGDRLRVTTSTRGASLGRNTGVGVGAQGLDDALLMFPNDTTWFPEGAIAAIRGGMKDAQAGAVTVMTSSGPRFVLPAPGTRLDATTVWKVIEMGLVMRLGMFRRLGGFDESIGTGAPSPWQAGEVTDLLMRARLVDRSLETSFRWIADPAAAVGGIPEASGLTSRERRRKLRAYGRGVGHVFRIHDFPAWHRVRFAVAGLLIGLLRSGEYSVGDGPAALLGRCEGLTGRPIGEGDRTAVER